MVCILRSSADVLALPSTTNSYRVATQESLLYLYCTDEHLLVRMFSQCLKVLLTDTHSTSMFGVVIAIIHCS